MSRELEKYVDVNGALARMGGNAKIYAKALNMFLNSKEMENFEAAVLENNLEKAGGHIHTLKGVAGNLSLTGLSEQSGRIMLKLKRGEAVDPQWIENFRETYALTLDRVRELIRELES